MNCMKCGRELKTTGVFCAECLADMENYPVKSNITIQLPHRPAVTQTRKRKQRYIKPEDQIKMLKKTRNWLIFLLVVALLAFGAVSSLTLYLLETNQQKADIGKNYGTIETTDNT